MKNRYALYPIIMSTFAFACFIAALFFVSTAVEPPWLAAMVLIMPTILLGIIGYFALRGKLCARATAILTTPLSFFLFLASVLYLLFLSMEAATTVTTDIRYYSRAYAQIDRVDEVKAVFPGSIPVEAVNIEFTYNPQFMQGAEKFKLSYTTTDEMLTEWKSLLSSKAKRVEQDHHDIFDLTADDKVSETMYILIFRDGNHGEKCYVSIIEETQQITFYYSRW